MPGEGIDSWLEATARRMEVSLGAVARALDLPTATRPAWIKWLSRDQLDAIANATGTSSYAIRAMTLSIYDRTALQLDADSHRLDPTFPFGALSWSRYCPQCLRESQGRWQLAWRLGWCFACVLHNCLLADACPSCGKYQRRQQLYRRVPTPTMCVCGHNLSADHTDKLPVDHVIIDAQQHVFDIINNNDDDVFFGVFRDSRSSVHTVLTAVRSLTNRLLNYASTHGLAAVKPAEVSWLISDDRELKALLARNALNDTAPTRAIETAVGVTAALYILQAPTIIEAGHRARPFIEGQNADTGPAELRSCPRDGGIPTAIVIKARSRDMGPELQLRYRTAIDMPCVPDLDARRVQSIAAVLPAAMWPAWSQRLLTDIRRTTAARTTLSCATLLAGSTLKPVVAARLLEEVISPNALNQRLWVLCGSAHWQSICAAIIRLSDYLDDHGGPIDYQRRRHLDYTALLPEDSWRDICARSGVPMAEPSTAVGARCHLIDKLSGTPALALLTLSEELDERSLTTLVTSFRLRMTPHLDEALDENAQSFLVQHNIDEPVAWHPPLELLENLHLPDLAEAPRILRTAKSDRTELPPQTATAVYPRTSS